MDFDSRSGGGPESVDQGYSDQVGGEVFTMDDVGTFGLDMNIENDSGEIFLFICIEEVDELLFNLLELAFSKEALSCGGVITSSDRWIRHRGLRFLSIRMHIFAELHLLFFKALVMTRCSDGDRICSDWL